MINAYCNEQGFLRPHPADAAAFADALWLDLVEPTRDEEGQVETLVGIDVPTRDEMEEIELSSRLYYEHSAAFMTATLPSNSDSDEPHLAPVTFVLTGDRLVTVRYHEPRAFKTLPQRAARVPVVGTDGASVLVALLELQIDRLADMLERVGRDIHDLSRQVFQQPGPRKTRNADLQATIEAIGRKGGFTSNVLECLVSLDRMFGFLNLAIQQRARDRDLQRRVKTLARDCRSLIEHAGSLTQNVTFLLDATLGLINIEQNTIIKIFSIAAVGFLPPTLVASIYGMNFHVMPELDWPFGYPFAILLMVLSALLPVLFFKRRGWL